jgi:hypothetical protein
MRTDDGFVHAWVLPAAIDEQVWHALRSDVLLVVHAASHELERHRAGDSLAMLRGPEGLGHLVLDADCIAFNGNAFLGQAADPFTLERHAAHGVLARVRPDGTRRTVRRCDTAGYPYDLVVCATLLVVLRHLEGRARVGTTGTLRTGWGRAAALVRATLGPSGQLVQHENGLLRWVDAPERTVERRLLSS